MGNKSSENDDYVVVNYKRGRSRRDTSTNQAGTKSKDFRTSSFSRKNIKHVSPLLHNSSATTAVNKEPDVTICIPMTSQKSMNNSHRACSKGIHQKIQSVNTDKNKQDHEITSATTIMPDKDMIALPVSCDRSDENTSNVKQDENSHDYEEENPSSAMDENMECSISFNGQSGAHGGATRAQISEVHSDGGAEESCSSSLQKNNSVISFPSDPTHEDLSCVTIAQMSDVHSDDECKDSVSQFMERGSCSNHHGLRDLPSTVASKGDEEKQLKNCSLADGYTSPWLLWNPERQTHHMVLGNVIIPVAHVHTVGYGYHSKLFYEHYLSPAGPIIVTCMNMFLPGGLVNIGYCRSVLVYPFQPADVDATT